jgi:uncharacterized protein
VRAAIGLVAKAPVAGQVKTRLCPPCTPEEAAEIATALLLDTAASAAATGHDVWCVHLGDPAGLGALLPGVPLLAQRGADLGERLAGAQADLHGRGYDRVVLLGDCPTVEPALLAAAVAALDGADVVLGPARDGGYTLIGTAVPRPEVLVDVEMSTPRVLADTLARAEAAALRVALVAERHDLDTVADLAAALAAGQLDHAPRTRAAAVALAGR